MTSSRQRGTNLVRRHHRGFTLVEALVALLVLSVGLLGIAALYVETLRASRMSLYRTQAVNLATDLADRMRANRLPATAYNCGSPCVPANGGNPIAIADLTAWMARIGAALPGGTANVTFVAGTATTPDAYLIRVRWTEVEQATPVDFQLRVEI
jgi:type IV pilus assembly protein PilV